MCTRVWPIQASNQIASTRWWTDPNASATYIPHRESRRVDLRDNQDLLPAQRRTPARPDLRGAPSSAPETLPKNFSPAALIRRPVSTIEGHEVTLVAVLRRLDVAVYRRCAARGHVRAHRKQPGHTTPPSTSQVVPCLCTFINVGAPLVPRLKRGLNRHSAASTGRRG